MRSDCYAGFSYHSESKNFHVYLPWPYFEVTKGISEYAGLKLII
jgi:hypothetical protein